ncbi:uncharacterized protein OCT59_016903 [Rhizophagus irregularis]|uniref:uncharacterized protein n=1 Tax=Rhizophagus irregularis TaxID=588596 RepID=UPI003332F2CC|nr:hypothetical protein OCT59_016903 [Rhizophagus irregularis]
MLSSKVFGFCPKCKKPNSHYHWSQGGFSTVYEAIWLDGLIDKWDYENQKWERETEELDEQVRDVIDNKIKNPLKSDEKYGYYVVLKCLDNSSNMDDHFLNEWEIHLQCQHKVTSNGSILVPLIGITKDPDTSNYMVVMVKLPFGSLRNNLLLKKYNPNDKYHNLFLISTQLEAIHELNLVHGDFHSGNLLCHDHELVTISDLGLCRPIDQPNIKDEEDEENRIPIPDNEEVKCHPESYYTSRKIDYSDELNQQFEFELSNKIVITEDNHDYEIKMSESLGKNLLVYFFIIDFQMDPDISLYQSLTVWYKISGSEIPFSIDYVSS